MLTVLTIFFIYYPYYNLDSTIQIEGNSPYYKDPSLETFAVAGLKIRLFSVLPRYTTAYSIVLLTVLIVFTGRPSPHPSPPPIGLLYAPRGTRDPGYRNFPIACNPTTIRGIPYYPTLPHYYTTQHLSLLYVHVDIARHPAPPSHQHYSLHWQQICNTQTPNTPIQ